MRPLILASASPRRRELLASLGVSFTVVVAQVTEHEESTTDPRLMVAHNAALKAEWVAERNPDAIVLVGRGSRIGPGAILDRGARLEPGSTA